MPSRGGAAQFDTRCALLHQFGLLDHHHRVGAARDHAAGRDRCSGAGFDLQRRRVAAGNHLGIEREDFGRRVTGANCIGRAQRKTIDIGAVERRRIDRGHDIMRQHARERTGKRYRLGAERR